MRLLLRWFCCTVLYWGMGLQPVSTLNAATIPVSQQDAFVQLGERSVAGDRTGLARKTGFGIETIFFLVGMVIALMLFLVASLAGAIILFAFGYTIAGLLALSPLATTLLASFFALQSLDAIAGAIVFLFLAGCVALAVYYFKLGLILGGFLALSPFGLFLLVLLLSLIVALISDLVG